MDCPRLGVRARGSVVAGWRVVVLDEHSLLAQSGQSALVEVAGAAFGEAFQLLRQEIHAGQAEPADDDQPITLPGSQLEDDDLRRRNRDLAATLGDVLSQFTVTNNGGQVVRTGYLGTKTLERRRQALTDNARREAQADHMPKVQGSCPACGRESLFLGGGGFVTCAMLSCPKPDAPTDALENLPRDVDDRGRTDCTTALAGALERARRARDAYETLRADVVTVAKYIAQQQRLGRIARSSRSQVLTTLGHWLKDPGPLTPHTRPALRPVNRTDTLEA
ncbi:hypothetical protein ACIQ9J_17715 [Streptomyces sp. NPDC094153]|uniref:hypothetical protein n=1 Tax=Streptomyces sp. NPDC094153 TaxID=3366058 RepID=UPI0038072770